ncbi:MAG: fructose-bisphosphatase class III, partial [Bacteroidia bacterium]
IKEKATHTEVKDPYFTFRDNEAACKKILQEFGLDPEDSHIVNGHVPVKDGQGESPIKANGKLLVIDGGMSPAYHKSTGLHGYTLIYNSYGLVLVAHKAIDSIDEIIKNDLDMSSETRAHKHKVRRKRVADTNDGKL